MFHWHTALSTVKDLRTAIACSLGRLATIYKFRPIYEISYRNFADTLAPSFKHRFLIVFTITKSNSDNDNDVKISHGNQYKGVQMW